MMGNITLGMLNVALSPKKYPPVAVDRGLKVLEL
jgi:hypothetical protein